MKKVLAVLIAAVMVLSLAGCELFPKEKPFSVDEMLITLTDAFAEAEFEGYTKAFDSRKAAVFVLREDKALLNGVELSLAEYAELTKAANANRGPGEIKTEDGLTYFEYESYGSDEQTIYSYFTTMFESKDAFWLVQFTGLRSEYEKLRPEFVKYAQSVTFGDAAPSDTAPSESQTGGEAGGQAQ